MFAVGLSGNSMRADQGGKNCENYTHLQLYRLYRGLICTDHREVSSHRVPAVGSLSEIALLRVAPTVAAASHQTVAVITVDTFDVVGPKPPIWMVCWEITDPPTPTGKDECVSHLFAGQ